MKTFVAGASLLASSMAGSPDYTAMWEQFKTDYNKNYNGNDEQMRFEIFKANVDIIDAHNAKRLSYWFGMNEFSDLTSTEFFSTHLGYIPGKPFISSRTVPFANITDALDSIDWVAKGAVTPVKDQASCGSCWAFSTTGSVEGAYFLASGQLTSLSEEDLVQCDHNGDEGCGGGLMEHAFQWIEQNGIASEQNYPYTSGGGITGSCEKGHSPVVTITGFTKVPSGDETALKAAVSKQPVSVAIEADKSAFQHYAGGVLDNPACGTKLDHGVLAVGYGTDGGKDYWKVKNSWGATWGEQGYIRMVRNKNQCGIAAQSSYPTGAKAAGPSPPPPPPSPPVKGDHYGDPAKGCLSDEDVVTPPRGVKGTVCGRDCFNLDSCPAPPEGVTAKPSCGQMPGQDVHCILTCSALKPGCPKGAQCKGVGFFAPLVGMCTYPNSQEPVVV